MQFNLLVRPLLSGILLISLLFQAAPVFAQTGIVQAAPELEAFFDGLITAQLAAYSIPGAALSIVADGNIVLVKGYGYADLETRLPVDGELSLFRPGSISKTFIWTAVMQLYEQGKLDLNVDIQKYLDFKLNTTYEQPITMLNLMSHTPGFEDRSDGLFVRSSSELLPLGEYLRLAQPVQIYPPGEISAYSNYGVALAGYIIERVSGIPYEQYLEEYIFQPLGMSRSTFRQPVPSHLADALAAGYRCAKPSACSKGSFEFVQASPAGALSSTAADMAKFMLAHLNGGVLDGQRILEAETLELMHTGHFSHDPRLKGWAHGFFESELRGVRILSHAGDTIYFHSDMLLFPDHNLGIFVSYNSENGSLARMELLEAFLERYFPAVPLPDPNPTQAAVERLKPFAGSYFSSRRNVSGREKFFSALQAVSLSVEDTGIISIRIPGLPPIELVEIEPFRLAPIHGGNEMIDQIILRQEANPLGGVNTYVLTGTSALLKSAAAESPTLHLSLLIAGFLLNLSVLAAVPIGVLFRWQSRHLGAKFQPPQPLSRLARWTAVLYAVLFIVFLSGYFLLISDITNIAFGIPLWAELISQLPIVILLLAAAMVIFAFIAWLNGWWTKTSRLHYTLITVFALIFIWQAWFWNFLF